MNAVILPGNDAGEDFYFNSKEKNKYADRIEAPDFTPVYRNGSANAGTVLSPSIPMTSSLP